MNTGNQSLAKPTVADRIFIVVGLLLSALLIWSAIRDSRSDELPYEQIFVEAILSPFAILALIAVIAARLRETRVELLAVGVALLAAVLDVGLALGWGTGELAIGENSSWVVPLAPAALLIWYIAGWATRKVA